MSVAAVTSACSVSYAFHGVDLVITADTPQLLDAIGRRFAPFPAGTGAGPRLTFGFHTISTRAERPWADPPASARSVYDTDSGEVRYADDEDALYMDSGQRIWARCLPSLGLTEVVGLPSAMTDLWLTSRPFMTLPLIESLKRRGLYSLHASGAELDGKAVLIAGHSGAGKSTLAAALVRAGFAFIGDDMAFLVEREGDLGIRAFPDESDLTDESARLIPELAYLADGEMPLGWPKRRVRLEQAFGAEIAWRSAPAAILFPRVASSRAITNSERVREDEALLELAPNVLLTDVAASQRHLNVLAALVETIPCYRLTLGRDLDAAVTEVRMLLRTAGQQCRG